MDFISDKEDALVNMLAELVNDAIRVYCIAHQDFSQPMWSDATAHQCDFLCFTVRAFLEKPDLDLSDKHDHDVLMLALHGWKYGPEMDNESKTHPCLRYFDTLTAERRGRLAMVKSIVINARDLFTRYIDILSASGTDKALLPTCDNSECKRIYNQVILDIQKETGKHANHQARECNSQFFDNSELVEYAVASSIYRGTIPVFRYSRDNRIINKPTLLKRVFDEVATYSKPLTLDEFLTIESGLGTIYFK